MTNPNNSIGTNGAFGGRTSVNALNDVLGTFAGRGILSGWQCVPSDGMTVALGGVAGVRDVAIAEDNNGNKTTINNISEAAVEMTLEAAPSVNSRIDSIVAYVANPPQGATDTIDNPGAAGLIAVSGATASSPVAPAESAIRTAITADGATGSNAYYAVLANVTVAAGTTTITGDAISAGAYAKAGVPKLISAENVDWSTTHITGWSFVTAPSLAKTVSKTISLPGVSSVDQIKSITLTLLGINQTSDPTSISSFPNVFAPDYPTMAVATNISANSFTATISRATEFGAGWRMGFCYDVELA